VPIKPNKINLFFSSPLSFAATFAAILQRKRLGKITNYTYIIVLFTRVVVKATLVNSFVCRARNSQSQLLADRQQKKAKGVLKDL